MKKPTPELGNRELHSRHSVMIEGGPVPRAKVMDQQPIDRLLMQGEVTLAQHQAAEYLMELSALSGIYAKAPNPDAIRGGVKDFVPMGVFRLGGVLRLVRTRCGPAQAAVVEGVVCHGRDVCGEEKLIELLREGLQEVSESRMSGGRNPVRHISDKSKTTGSNKKWGG